MTSGFYNTNLSYFPIPPAYFSKINLFIISANGIGKEKYRALPYIHLYECRETFREKVC